MAGMVKTTVYMDEETARQLRERARREGRPQAELIREALRAHLQGDSRPELRGVGAFRSGRGDVSERAEELLRAAARDR